MRILFVHNGSDLYGASRSLLRLAAGLVREKYEVYCVLPYDGPLVERLQAISVQVILHRDLAVLRRPELRNLPGILRFLFRLCSSTLRLQRLIKSLNPHIVHTNVSVIPSSSLAVGLTGARNIQHIREHFEEFGIVWKIYQHLLLTCADIIVCVSVLVAKQFSRQSDKIVTVYDGCSPDEFPEVSKSTIDAFREEYGIHSGPVVGVVGRIKFHRKGQEVLIQAAALLKEKHPAMQILIVGSPFPGNEDHLDRLHAMVRRLNLEDRVIFAGDVNEMGVVYNVLDILVMPSCLPEPFGGVVKEAMANGKPAIANRGGGGEEQIEDGVTGLLVEPCDPLALSTAIDRLLSDDNLRQTMGKRAKARFDERFKFETFLGQMIGLYESIARGRKSQ